MENTDPQYRALDLIDFYAGGSLSERNLELIKHRVERKADSESDPDLKPLVSYRESIKALQQIHARRRLEPIPHHLTQPVLHELLHLRPQDFLIVLAAHRYEMPDEELSLILGVSVDHLKFRRQQITQLIAAPSPAELKKICTSASTALHPDSAPIPLHRRSFVDRFRALPLPARFMLETGIVLSVLIFLMWLIPEVRNRYESSVQKRINDYMIESTISDAPAPEGTSKTPKIVEPPAEEAAKEAPADEPEQKAADNQNKRPLKVAAGETWRFSFTGPATNDIMNGVNETLKKLGLEETKSITVPGGIQFDFFIPTGSLANLKLNLEDMTANLQRRTSSSTPDAPAVVNMSWYKKRGMTGRKVPAGNVEVVIWVSTL